MAAGSGPDSKLVMMRTNAFAALDEAIGIQEQLDGLAFGNAGEKQAARGLGAGINLRTLAEQNFFGGGEFRILGSEFRFAERSGHDLAPAITALGQAGNKWSEVGGWIKGAG